MRHRDPAQLIGQVIDGRYELLQCIGEGGMGVVYKARQTSIDRMVAVKMLSSNLAKDRSWVQRFYNEAKACSRLHHPNTIRMFDFGQTKDGQLFMAMEYLDGLGLRQVIASDAPLDPLRALKIVIQCCASPSEAHNLGIIHRDIKADNVVLLDLPGSRDHVKLLDFGVAKLLMAEDFATQAGMVFGTPQYMSPEQGRGEPLTPRADLYGVGILAYEMLMGTVPFSDPIPMSVIHMHLQSPVPPMPPRVPGSVQAIVMRALEKDMTRRYATAAAMMDDCQSVLTALQTGQFRALSASAAGSPAGFAVMAGGASGSHAAMFQSPSFAPAPGPPPPAPPSTAFAASIPTMLDRPNPLMSSSSGGMPVAAASAAAKTVLVHSAGPVRAHHPPSPQPNSYPPAPMPGGPGDLRTIMLPNSEGIVSMHGDALARGSPGSGVRPILGPGSQRGTSSGASALFWIFCLLTGLAVGVGAYWLVLELAK